MSLLELALQSLAAQRDVALDVMVVVDDCPPTMSRLLSQPSFRGAIRSVRAVHLTRGPEERSGPVRVARLREAAVGLVNTSWAAFLDDDNVLEPSHFSMLLECVLRRETPAAHSWRSLWTWDGRPFPLVGRHPWCREPQVATRLFEQYKAAGIYQRGSHVVRDQVVPYRRHLSMVDTSEWIFRTTYLAGLQFCQHYTAEDWRVARTEDSKLLDQIVEQGLQVPSTRRPTLRYRLGGYSNNPSHEAAALAGWLH